MRRGFALTLLAFSIATCRPAQVDAAGTCTVSVTAVAFASYSPLSTTADTASGAVTVKTCGVADSGTISISAGNSGAFATRTMTGAGTLDYNLYTTSAHSTIWGNGTDSTSTVSWSVANGTATSTSTIYGSVPAQQNVAAGSYSDSLMVTVTF